MNVGWVTGVIHVESLPNQLIDFPVKEEDLGMAKDHLNNLIGEGDARVSVSYNLKDGEFGRGFGAHVSVSLVCDQRQSSVRNAYDHASELAEDFTNEAFARAKDMADEHGLLR